MADAGETKNVTTMTFEPKVDFITWAYAVWSWNKANAYWEVPKIVLR